MEVCIYCGEPRGEKIGCCGENHWEDVPEEENDALASRPFGWGLMLDSEQVA